MFHSCVGSDEEQILFILKICEVKVALSQVDSLQALTLPEAFSIPQMVVTP